MSVNYYFKKTFIAFFITITLVISVAGFELIGRPLNLTERYDADFKFYVHNVDNDSLIVYNQEDALLMWSPQPNYSDGKIHINSQGFRDKEYSIKKPKNTFRILCLGDSSTFFGSYHSLLEDNLNNDFISQHTHFEIINAGVTGYTSYQGLCMYKYKGARYSPDIVTFYFGINDPIKRFYLSDKEILQEKIPAIVKIIKNRFLLKLESYRLIRKFINNISKKEKISWRENVPRVSLSDFRENVLNLRRLCEQNGALLIIISPPLCKEISLGWRRTPDIIMYRKELKNISTEYKIPYIEIKEMTERSQLPTMQYFKGLVHPNELGHELIMQRLYDYLITHNLLPIPERRSRVTS